MPSGKTQWYGDKVEKDIISALTGGVNASLNPILADSQKSCPVDTGKLKASGKIKKAKRDGDETYGIVIYTAPYAIYPEMKTKFLRRAAMKNENASLKNFQDKLK